MNPYVRLLVGSVGWFVGRLVGPSSSVGLSKFKSQGSFTSMLLSEHLFFRVYPFTFYLSLWSISLISLPFRRKFKCNKTEARELPSWFSQLRLIWEIFFRCGNCFYTLPISPLSRFLCPSCRNLLFRSVTPEAWPASVGLFTLLFWHYFADN